MTALVHPPNHHCTVAALPRYRRVLALLDAGVPLAEIARMERVTRQRIYKLVHQALRARERGYLSPKIPLEQR